MHGSTSGCLFVCLFVYLLDVDSWYCSGESVGHRLGNIANQWKNIVCSAAAEHCEPVPEPPAASPQLHPASSSCASSELQLFPHYTLYKHTHTHRQAVTLFHPIFFLVNFLTETLTSYRFCLQSYWLKNSSSSPNF